MRLFAWANVEQKSPCLAWPYLVQDVEMPFCVGEGAAEALPEALPDAFEGDEDAVLVGVVELRKGAVVLVDAPVSLPPRCSAPAFVDVFDTGGGM